MSFPLPPLKYDIHSLSLSLDLRETKNHNQLDAVAWCMDPPFLCERFLKSELGHADCLYRPGRRTGQSGHPPINRRMPPSPATSGTGAKSMRQRLCPTESDPPTVTRSPNSYRVLANPRYKKLTAIECASPLSANPFQSQPIKNFVNSRVRAPQHGQECGQRNTPGPYYVKSKSSHTPYGNRPTSCGQGSIGIIGPQ